jgi:hypothetical protein
MRWTWFNEAKGECWEQTFATPDQAVEEMARRMGDHADGTPEAMARIGIYLALAEVTVKPVMVLREHQPT